MSATCPDCRRRTKGDLLFEETIETKGAGWWYDHFRTLRCRGCEAVFFQKFTKTLGAARNNPYDLDNKYDWYEDYTYFPSPSRRMKPKWYSGIRTVDQALADLYDELYLVLESDALICATIAVRTVVDRSSEILGIDKSKSFKEKLEELHREGFIGETEMNMLSVAVEAGHAAAHRAWKPEIQQLHSLIDVIDGFLRRIFLIVRI